MKKILTTLVILSTIYTGFAAIAFENKTAASTVNPTPLSFSCTSSGTDRIAFVSATSNGGFTVSSVTYNGVAMTQVGSKSDGPTQYLYYIVNPPTGASTVTITTTGSAVAGSCSTYSGVDQTTPIDNSTTTGTVTTTSFSSTVTVNTNNSWTLATSRAASASALTAGAGTTLRNQVEATFFGGGGIWDSNGPLSTGANTLTVTSASQQFGGAIMVSIKPSGSATAPNTLGFFRFFRRF